VRPPPVVVELVLRCSKMEMRSDSGRLPAESPKERGDDIFD
jgi:hypothetical protein